SGRLFEFNHADIGSFALLIRGPLGECVRVPTGLQRARYGELNSLTWSCFFRRYGYLEINVGSSAFFFLSFWFRILRRFVASGKWILVLLLRGRRDLKLILQRKWIIVPLLRLEFRIEGIILTGQEGNHENKGQQSACEMKTKSLHRHLSRVPVISSKNSHTELHEGRQRHSSAK